MHNDSKLGLLAGVGGVVVAAVLLTQNPSAPSVPADRTAKDAPVAAATPAKPSAPSTPVVARSKPELEGKTTSRPARDDDE